MRGQTALKGRKGQKGRKPKYEVALKRRVASEYIHGDRSTTELGEFFNVPHQSVSRWAKQFSSELPHSKNIAVTDQEQKEMAELQNQLKLLKEKLEYEQMKNFALETLVDLAKEELGIDLRKNSGAKQPEE